MDAMSYRSLDASFLPDDIADALRRRLREVGGLALLARHRGRGRRARDLVGAGSELELCHQRAGAQSPRPRRRHHRRPDDAAVRACLDRADRADRGLGLAVADRIARSRTKSWRVVFWIVGVLLAAAFASCLPRTARLAAADRPRRRRSAT